MPRHLARHALLIFATTAALAVARVPTASAITVATGNGSGLAGALVEITLTAGNTTGLNIRSLQFDLTYNGNFVTATDVIEAGTLVGAAGWGDATFNVTTGASGKIRVSHAGTTALTGSGALLKIQFQINPAQLAGASTSLTLSNFVFNEGTPNDTTSNGTLTINATPIVTVSPNTGEVVRTQTLQFSLTGTVSNPVTWSTTNNAIATISSSGLLTGVAPGEVKVIGVDAAARRDTSDGVILIRGMGITAGSGNVYVNHTISVPLTVTSLAGLGIRSGQVTLSFNPALLTATGITRPPGTLLDGVGPVFFGAGNGTCTIDFSTANTLSGSGVLCYVQLAAGSTQSSATLTVSALFNETLPAKPTNGSVIVDALPTLIVSPDNVTLFAGQSQQFSVGGAPVLPVTWSLTDSTVGTISSSGLFTAVKGGTTQVRATDNVGATDLNLLVDVYDFRVTAGTLSVLPGQYVNLPIYADRKVGTQGIRSVQYELGWTGAYVTSVASTSFGLIPTWANLFTSRPTSTSWRLAAANAQPLANTDSVLHRVRFDISAAAPIGTNIPITITTFLCNEGSPRVLKTNGIIQVRNTTDVPDGEVPALLALAPPRPNPTSGPMVMRFAIPVADRGEGERVHLEMIGIDGRRVRTLIDSAFPPGTHEAVWDGRDDAGNVVADGVYFARLAYLGRTETRKVAVVR